MENLKLDHIYVGDCLDVLRSLPDESIHMCVTSPPYWGLRDYKMPGQLGLEPTPEEYTQHIVDVFGEVRRVLRDDGTLWLNLGDSYYNNNGGGSATMTTGNAKAVKELGRHNKAIPHEILKIKDLIGIPWRVAFALQADGWYLRSDIIWNKPNAMPESVTDRPTKAHEYVFLMTKSPRYYYDNEAIKEPLKESSIQRISQTTFDSQTGGEKDYSNGINPNRSMRKTLENFRKSTAYSFARKVNESPVPGLEPQHREDREPVVYVGSRNKRSVWNVSTKPFAGAHFATFPEELIEPCILAGSSQYGSCSECGAPWERIIELEGQLPGRERDIGGRTDGYARPAQWENGENPTTIRTVGWEPTCKCNSDVVPCVVLDPFFGSGTTGVVANKNRRSFVGIDLNPEYVEDIALPRLQGIQLNLLID